MTLGKIPNTSVGKGEKITERFDLFESFNNAAEVLHAISLGCVITKRATKEFYQDCMIAALCLYRHALELGIKALWQHGLISEQKKGHDLENLFTGLPENVHEVLLNNKKYISDETKNCIVVMLTNGISYHGTLENLLDDCVKRFKENIIKAFGILDNSYLTKDEQLFRYDEHAGKKEFKDLKKISKKEIYVILRAINWLYGIKQLLNSVQHSIHHNH
jgi:hypothetical protein